MENLKKMPDESATDYRNRVREWRKANKKPETDIGTGDIRKTKDRQPGLNIYKKAILN
ncbi:hypothetical protein [Photorhabdus temperata]|uniref:hypothetical protein n=1 Tax=Photorhabdus temperata TaxID=574560 RepID=UPI001FB0899A|nr:hypothetical protein [Photorhabdus temperata]